MNQNASRIGKLILVPAVITLAVTLLRLVGELQGWSPALFNRGDKPFSPSLVGIVWLVPVFGAWFGWKLIRAGSGPGSLGRAFGVTFAALAVMPLAAFLAPKAGIVPGHMWESTPTVLVNALPIRRSILPASVCAPLWQPENAHCLLKMFVSIHVRSECCSASRQGTLTRKS